MSHRPILIGFVVLTLLSAASPAGAAWVRDGVRVAEVSEFEAWKMVPQGGGAIIAWGDYRCVQPGTTSCFGIFGRRIVGNGDFDPAWDPLGSVLVFPTDQWRAHLAELIPDGGGGVWAIYHQMNALGHGNMRVAASHFQTGGPVWTDALLDSATTRSGYTGLLGDGAGGSIATWSEDRNAIYQNHVYVERLGPDGTPLWTPGERRLSVDPLLFWSFGVTADGAGGQVVAWTEDGTPTDLIRLQRVDAAGEIAWGQAGVVLGPVGKAYNPFAMVEDGTGGAFLAWYDTRADAGDIYLVRVEGSGEVPAGWNRDGNPVCAAPQKQSLPSLLPDGIGGVYATWRDARGAVYVQRMTAAGVPAFDWPADGLLIGGVASTDEAPALATDGAGGLYVVWSDVRNGASNRDIYAQHVLSNAAIASGWAAGGNPVCVDPATQYEAAIIADGAGGAIVAWRDGRVTNQESVASIFAQGISPDGVTPTRIDLGVLDLMEDGVRITGRSNGGGPVELWRRHGEEAARSIAVLTPDALGEVRYEDRDVEPGERYAYALREAGGFFSTAESWITVPARTGFAIEGLVPNPAPRELRVAFALARRAPALIELVDLRGRKVLERSFSSLDAGRHVIDLAARGEVPPGVYWVRLTSEGHALTKQAIVVR